MYHLGKKRCSMLSGIVSQGLLKKDVYSIDGASPDVLGMSSSGTCAPQTITPNWLLNPALKTSWLGPLTNNFLRTQEKSIVQINFFCDFFLEPNKVTQTHEISLERPQS